jgi:hypothetical protein
LIVGGVRDAMTLAHKERERRVAEEFVRALREGRVEPLPPYPNVSFLQEQDDPPDIWLTLDDGGDCIGVELTHLLPANRGFQKKMKYLVEHPGTASSYSLQVAKDVRDCVLSKNEVVGKPGRIGLWLLLHEPLPPPNALVFRDSSDGNKKRDMYRWYYPYSPVGIEAHHEVREGLAAFFSECVFSRILLQTSNLGREYWSVIYDREGR